MELFSGVKEKELYKQGITTSSNRVDIQLSIANYLSLIIFMRLILKVFL
jgi:hypothetical protein